MGFDLSKYISSIEILEEEAKTIMIITDEEKIVGFIAVADTIKSDSVLAIKELKDMGIETVMITEDNKKTAEAIAKETGISKTIAEVLPEGKVHEIKNLQNEGKIVAIPAASLGMLHPVIAEAAMASSSINVVTNANLLRFVDIRPEYKKINEKRKF